MSMLRLRHESLPIRDYHRLPDLGSSTLKALESETAEYVAANLDKSGSDQDSSRALVFGQAVHAILDGSFTSDFVVAPDSYRTATSDKFATFAANAMAESGRTALIADEYESISKCGDSLARALSAWLVGKRKWREPTLRWTHKTAEHRDIACKCRPDLLVDDGDGGAVYIEIKTARSASTKAIRRDFWQYGYWLQQAHYEAGIIACGARYVRTVFAFVRKSSPYDVRFIELGPEDHDSAKFRWGELVEEYGRRVEKCDWSTDSIRCPSVISLGLDFGPKLEGFSDGGE